MSLVTPNLAVNKAAAQRDNLVANFTELLRIDRTTSPPFSIMRSGGINMVVNN